MKFPGLQRRTLALIGVLVPLLILLAYVAVRSGPLAPVAVTVMAVEAQAIEPGLSGIGTVQARYAYKIGPTFAGRVKLLEVHVGDEVEAGQVLGEMDPVDLDDRIGAQQAAIKSLEAALWQAEVKQTFARTQVKRYDQLMAVRGTSEEALVTKRQELAVADAALRAVRADVGRARAELEMLRTQRSNLRLIAPVAGLVVARDADPGTTVVAGQPVVELLDPTSLWIDTRFDQINATGLAAGLPARIALRSRQGQTLQGRVLRVDPLADAITEEILAKIVFSKIPEPLPPVGELAEVTVRLSRLSAAPTIPNAAIHNVNGQRGVWKLEGNKLVFTAVVLGRSDLEGQVQVRKGLTAGERIVVYSERALRSTSSIHVVDRIPGVLP